MPEAAPDTTMWLGIGFLLVWTLIGGYVVFLFRRQRDLQSRVERLESAAPSERTPPTPG